MDDGLRLVDAPPPNPLHFLPGGENNCNKFGRGPGTPLNSLQFLPVSENYCDKFGRGREPP